MSAVEELKHEQEVWQHFMQCAMRFAMEVLGEGSNVTPVSLLERWAEEIPDRPAILSHEGKYNYKEFNARANQVARVLCERGAKKGDSVALLMDSRPEFLFSVMGAAKNGMVTGLINTNLLGDQLKHALGICDSSFVIVGSEHLLAIKDVVSDIDIPLERVFVWSEDGSAPRLEGVVDFAKEVDAASGDAIEGNEGHDNKLPFIYICTSGTTGLPKAALVPNQRYLQGVFYYGQTVLEAKESDVMYTCGLPLYHNVAISNGWGIALSGGGAVAIRRRFSASAFWEDCDEFGCTMFTYVGEVCRYLMKSDVHPKEKTHALRCIVGAGLRADIWEAFLERFDVPKVFEYYGATEGNVGLINLTGKPGMVGKISPERGHILAKVDPETEELIKEDGKLVAAGVGESGMLIAKIGPMAGFEGYVDKSKNASKVLENPFGAGDRYFNSGDMLTLSENNWVAFADRLGDTFRWKGENVSTNDVQETVSKCPGVKEANAYGVKVPDNDGRAGAVAIIVEDDFDLQKLAAYVVETLPAYARPLFVRIEETLKMTGSYKYVKTGLKADGFDPAKISTPLYFLNSDHTYQPVTSELYASICGGNVRL